LGTYTSEIGFNIYALNGTLLFSRTPYTAFNGSAPLGTFCPTSKCIVPISITYYITLSSSCGNGWGGNTLLIRQSNAIIATIGANFTSGSTFAVFNLTLKSTEKVDIVVGTLANGTERVGILFRNNQGFVVFQRDSGASYSANALLGSFTPNALAHIPPVFLAQQP
jgi:hypothetical protein